VSKHAIKILLSGNISTCMCNGIILKTELSGFDLCHDEWTRTRRSDDSKKTMNMRRVNRGEMSVVSPAGKLYLAGYL
jgi:hypothetical protein